MSKRRWGKQDDNNLKILFNKHQRKEEGGVDANNQTPQYIKNDVWAKNDWLKDNFAIKSFYVTYRRKANEWLTKQAKSDVRCKFFICVRFLEGGMKMS